MKRKILPLIMASMCATACAFGLAACGNTDEISSLRIAGADGQLVEELTYNVTYGETPDLDYKVYVTDQNDSKKEVNLDDSKLTVEYYYFGITNETIEKLPDEYLYGSYLITYNYKSGKSDFRAYVRIEVAKAESGAFSIQPEFDTWLSGNRTPKVTVKNPKGDAVAMKNGDELLPDDTNGAYGLYVMKKDAYAALAETDKRDYDYLLDYYTTSDGDVWYYVPEFPDKYPAGEYVLFALIDSTYNYGKTVTPAVNVTVEDSISG